MDHLELPALMANGVLPPSQHVRLKCTPKWHGCPNDLLPIFWVEKICEFPKESKDLRIVTMEDLVAIADPRMLKVARIVLLSWMRTLKLKSLDPEKMETAIVPVMVEVRLSKCLVPLVMN